MKQNVVVCQPGPALLFFTFRFEYLISGPKSYRDFRVTGPWYAFPYVSSDILAVSALSFLHFFVGQYVRMLKVQPCLLIALYPQFLLQWCCSTLPLANHCSLVSPFYQRFSLCQFSFTLLVLFFVTVLVSFYLTILVLISQCLILCALVYILRADVSYFLCFTRKRDVCVSNCFSIY